METVTLRPMTRGIAILGLNGSGKSTLAHALAKQTGFFEMDAEDYYFPEQRESRRQALENEGQAQDTAYLPYSLPRSKADVEAALLRDLQTHPRFILSGVDMNWRKEIIHRVDLAFLIETPKEERLRRIEVREEKRFGPRVLPGGDMYEQQKRFHCAAAQRDISLVEVSASNLRCPVIRLDGMRPLAENMEKALRFIDDMK